MAIEACSPEEIVARIEAEGIAVVPGFVDAARLERLRRDHIAVLERYHDGHLPPGDANLSAPLGTAAEAAPFAAIGEVFFSSWLRSICRGYLGADCAFNDTIYCTYERRPLQSITAAHFDTVQSLKAFLYLLDTTQANGAFRYAAGSHRANAKAAAAWRAAGGRVRETPNVARDDEAARMRPFEGDAGTLLIFDTNGFHCGGTLQPGRERRVIRSQSYPRPRVRVWPAYFSRQWFMETRWNPINRLRRQPVGERACTMGTGQAGPEPEL